MLDMEAHELLDTKLSLLEDKIEVICPDNDQEGLIFTMTVSQNIHLRGALNAATTSVLKTLTSKERQATKLTMLGSSYNHNTQIFGRVAFTKTFVNVFDIDKMSL